MSRRAYALRLALIFFIFVVAVPGVVLGLLYALEQSAGNRNAALGWGYAAFFIGIPLWALGFVIAICRAAYVRGRTAGLPAWIVLTLIVFLLADLRSVFEVRWLLHYLIFPPFLSAAIGLLVALMFWPDRTADGAAGDPSRAAAHNAAIWAWNVHAALASASLAAWILWFWTLSPYATLFQRYAIWAGRWWLFVLCGSMIWALFGGRRWQSTW